MQKCQVVLQRGDNCAALRHLKHYLSFSHIPRGRYKGGSTDTQVSFGGMQARGIKARRDLVWRWGLADHPDLEFINFIIIIEGGMYVLGPWMLVPEMSALR